MSAVPPYPSAPASDFSNLRGRLGRRRFLLGTVAGAAATLALRHGLQAADVEAIPQDFPVQDGHHFRQGSGTLDSGYEVRDIGSAQWWSAFRRAGGSSALGYPVSRPYAGAGGFRYQAFQRGLLQWSPLSGFVAPTNVMENLDAAGMTNWLLHWKGVPLPESDGAASFAESLAIRETWLTHEPIREVWSSNPDLVRFVTWAADDTIARWGLPMSHPQRIGPYIAQRFQRGVLQHWQDTAEGLPSPLVVTSALVGSMVVDAGLVPPEARLPIDSTGAYEGAVGTVAERLQAAIAARLIDEPGRWGIIIQPLGSMQPFVDINADVVMPSASVWKVTLLLEAYRRKAEGTLEISGRVRTALEAAMGVSDNNAAYYLGELLGYGQLDVTVQGLGATQTFVNTYYPETTARDARRMLGVAVGELPATWHRSSADVVEMRDLLLSESRDNRIPAQLPVGVRVAHKTGDLGGIINDAGVIYASTGPFAIVILVNGSPNVARSASAMAEIARMAYDALDPVVEFVPGPVG